MQCKYNYNVQHFACADGERVLQIFLNDRKPDSGSQQKIVTIGSRSMTV